MKYLILMMTLFLVACGKEPLQPVTCSGEIDGVTFTYSYEIVEKGGLGGPAIKTLCSHNDTTDLVEVETDRSQSGSLFQNTDRAAHTRNHCLMGADYVIQYDGGGVAVVSTNTNYTLQDRVELGTINCE